MTRKLNFLLAGGRLAGGLMALAVGACTVIEPVSLSHDYAPRALQAIQAADDTLQSLESVDILVRLDNTLLARQMQEGLEAAARQVESADFSDIKLQFTPQYIALEGRATVVDADGVEQGVGLQGQAILMFSGDNLIWQPQFEQIISRQQGDGPQAGPLPDELLEAINNELTGQLIASRAHLVPIDPMPLGILETGAALTQVDGVVAEPFQHLRGVFTTAGSAFLIESATSTIAVDLNFVPSVFTCPANVAVTRATFAREIRNREPIGSSDRYLADDEIMHFFTEIAGAEESTTVVHYWFADGLPVSVSELDVQPSARWRTWSTKPEGPESVWNWEVIVLEKESGCILESMSIVVDRHNGTMQPGSSTDARQAFGDYLEAFQSRVSGFSTATQRPEIASVEVEREFLAGVLNHALRDLEMVSKLQVPKQQEEAFEATLGIFNVEEIACERRQCQSERECIVDYDNCPIKRINRSCVSCLFRNPLNNRCVSEGEDPICVATSASLNAKIERTRQACIDNEQSARDACERLRTQEIRSCELEASVEISACESRQALVDTLQSEGTVADLRGEAALTGDISVSFSGFRFDNDLGRLRMDLGLQADLKVAGHLAFESRESLELLRSCIDAWQDSWSARIFLSDWENGLLGKIAETPGTLSTSWSGMIHPVKMQPSPVESLFVANPQLLADCQLGLTVGNVTDALEGESSGFFKGSYDLVIQPLPTRFEFLPASVTLDGRVRTGEAQLNDSHLLYLIEN